MMFFAGDGLEYSGIMFVNEILHEIGDDSDEVLFIIVYQFPLSYRKPKAKQNMDLHVLCPAQSAKKTIRHQKRITLQAKFRKSFIQSITQSCHHIINRSWSTQGKKLVGAKIATGGPKDWGPLYSASPPALGFPLPGP
jgi:hypothetical protein